MIINKADNQDMTEVYALAKELEMDVIGSVPNDNVLAKGSLEKNSEVVFEALKQLYFRLNLPQENN